MGNVCSTILPPPAAERPASGRRAGGNKKPRSPAQAPLTLLLRSGKRPAAPTFDPVFVT